MLPTDAELPPLISTLQEQLAETEAALAPYRATNNAKAPPTEQELGLLEAEWTHWRAEWKKRKTWFKGSVLDSTHRIQPPLSHGSSPSLGHLLCILRTLTSIRSNLSNRRFFMLIVWMYRLWSQVTDQLTPDAINALAEELGFEFDSPEHEALERGPLCQPTSRFKRTVPIKPAGVNR